MELTNNQLKIAEELHKFLVDDHFRFIAVTGESGCGKSTIINESIAKLKRSWVVSIIKNEAMETLEGYSIKASKRREAFPIPSISLKLGLISLGGSLRFQEVDSVFSDIQKQFMKDINKSIKKKLIIAYNYDRLDESTRLFINTLMYKLQNNKKVSFVISMSEYELIENFTPKFKEVPVQNMNENELTTYLESINIINIDFHKIYNMTKGNIGFLNKLISNNKIDLTIQTTKKLIQKKLLKTIDKYPDNKYIMEILRLGAYFENGFTNDQIIKIYEYSNNKMAILDTFNFLTNVNMLEKNENKYFFTLDLLKQFFIEKDSEEIKCYFYEHVYNYFTQYYDYLYDIRIYYLKKLIKYQKQQKMILNLIGLIFFSKCIDIYSGMLIDINEVTKSIEKYDSSGNFNDIVRIIRLINDKDKNRLIDFFNDEIFINNRWSILIIAEMERLKLEILVETSRNSTIIKKQIIKLITITKKLIDENHNEYRAWLHLSNTILSHMSNYGNMHKELSVYKEEYLVILERYDDINYELSDLYRHILKRKAALYDIPEFCFQEQSEAYLYFATKKDYLETYLSAVNLLGTSLVLAKYKKAQQLIYSISNHIDKYNDRYLPHLEKYYNNKLLYDFLTNEISNEQLENQTKNRDIILNKFEKLYNKYNFSNVIRMNYVSIYSRMYPVDGLVKVNEFLLDNTRAFNQDSFYLYYLNNIKTMIFIVLKDWINASKTLKYLKTVEIPAFYQDTKHCIKRLEALQLIIDNQIHVDNNNINTIIGSILKNPKFTSDFFGGLDESWIFMSLGFPLSDLQFFD